MEGQWSYALPGSAGVFQLPCLLNEKLPSSPGFPWPVIGQVQLVKAPFPAERSNQPGYFTGMALLMVSADDPHSVPDRSRGL